MCFVNTDIMPLKPEARSDQQCSADHWTVRWHLLRVSAFGFRLSGARAFSLIEIMVTVGLLSFIILGLLLMFNQTQRAFRSGLTQTDVLESGRATMDLLARELEQMSPSEAPDYIDSGLRRRATNFFVEPSTTSFGYNSTAPFSWIKPLVQELPGNAQSRTNLIQRFFFLSKLNQDWIGTGYEVVPDDANQCVGTLYRYTETNNPRGDLLHLSSQFLPMSITNRSRIADGIVHLRLRAYAANGRLITTNYLTGTNASYQVRFGGPYTNVPNAVAYNSAAYSSSVDLRQASCYFMSNAVPAYLELELGLLEPQVLQKYRSIGLQAPALQYLSNRVAHVHIFRQRIPVRNVDLSAYP
jgi:hypothetical protein